MTFTTQDLWYGVQLIAFVGAAYLSVRLGMNGLRTAMTTLQGSLNRETTAREKEEDEIKAAIDKGIEAMKKELRDCQAQRERVHGDMYDKISENKADLAHVKGKLRGLGGRTHD